ncbi:MAG: cell wall metabolism sensor histidine kinase WalK [Lachnospiraceae bacterium]|nr:cell wall metabolism sensor histidine kinase WalK [Lachnospiraceae bacterium]
MKKFHLSKLNISLRGFITFMIVLISGVILFAYSMISTKTYREKSIRDLESDIKLQCEILTYNLVNKSMDFDATSELDLVTDTVANFFNGRILVINEEYRIIKDTFGDRENAYIISDDVIRVMTGEKSELLSLKGDYIQYVYPVKSEGETLGVVLINASTAHIKNVTPTSSRTNITIATIIILGSIGVALFVGYSSVRGIKRINKEIENTRSGHLYEPLPVQGFKEFRTLTASYNKTIEKLMVIDSSRQEFVSNVSHELKTPITSMKVLADSLVQNQEADLEMYKEFMKDIIDEIDRESEIINDLLTLVKTDRKDAEMNISEVDVNELLEVILKRVTPIATSRGIEITYESYRDVVADADEVKLSLALTNIIENAVKYNVDNGWVKVTLNADHKNFHIKVADSGVGIPDDCKEHIFERFYRVDKARSRDTGGTGLGLAITRNVIRMHKGSIKLYSESGEGTTFTIKIPIKRVEG